MQLRGVLLELIIKIDLVLPTIYAYLQPAQGASKSKAIKELLFNKLRRDFFFFFILFKKKNGLPCEHDLEVSSQIKLHFDDS
jgi:hypothetical protein